LDQARVGQCDAPARVTARHLADQRAPAPEFGSSNSGNIVHAARNDTDMFGGGYKGAAISVMFPARRAGIEQKRSAALPLRRGPVQCDHLCPTRTAITVLVMRHVDAPRHSGRSIHGHRECTRPPFRNTHNLRSGLPVRQCGVLVRTSAMCSPCTRPPAVSE